MTASGKERALLVRLLVDAIEAVLRVEAGPLAARRAHDAREWIDADEPDWPLSFVVVCQALRVDATALRAALSPAFEGDRADVTARDDEPKR